MVVEVLTSYVEFINKLGGLQPLAVVTPTLKEGYSQKGYAPMLGV